MSGLLTLVLGFLLGVKHAFEADHVIAVSTIVTEQKNPLKAALVGTFWGIGHTTTLFIVGLLVLLLKIQIPEKVALSLEFVVGIMLVLLGAYTIYKTRFTLHVHKHEHKKGIQHEHPHWHSKADHKHHASFLIGSIHGLAGSGALMVLVLSTISSLIEGLYYILLFGIGSIAGMSIMSLVVGLPFIYSAKRYPNIEKYLRLVAGVLSILFGGFVMYKIGSLELGF